MLPVLNHRPAPDDLVSGSFAEVGARNQASWSGQDKPEKRKKFFGIPRLDNPRAASYDEGIPLRGRPTLW